VRILRQVLEPLLGVGVAGIPHEAVGLGERRWADEVRVDLE
jgi:hypothetical protein